MLGCRVMLLREVKELEIEFVGHLVGRRFNRIEN